MRIIVSLVFGAVLALTGCSNSGDVLATYKNGKLTRGELENWLSVRKMSTDTVYKNKRNQKSKIRKMVIDRLVVDEGEKKGFYKDPMYLKMKDLYDYSFSNKYFRKKIQETVSFKKEAVKLKVIKLRADTYTVKNKKRVKKSKQQLEKDIKAKQELAQSIIENLKKGKDFSALATQYSTDYSKKQGGNWGYLTKKMRHPVIMNPAFKLKKGEITEKPVRLRNSLYILKVEDRTMLTDDNIDSKISNKKKAKSLRRRLRNQAVAEIQQSMMNASDVKKHYDKANFKKPSELLFEVGDKKFTVKDLNEVLTFLDTFNGVDSSQKDSKRAIRRKKSISRIIFLGHLTEREIKKKGWHKTDDYKAERKAFINSIKANIYTGYKFRDIKISEKEMKRQYEKLKDRMFTRKKRVGKRVVKKVVPYNQAKPRLKQQLYGRKRGQARNQWHRRLLKASNFKINEKQLKGK